MCGAIPPPPIGLNSVVLSLKKHRTMYAKMLSAILGIVGNIGTLPSLK
jgi:hypothetical protein